MKPKARSAFLASVVCSLSLVLFSPGAAVALPPPPPNPSDQQVDAAASAKAQAEQAVASASAAVTDMNNQIEALNAQALAAADAYEQAQGKLQLAKENQAATQQALSDAATAVAAAEEAVKQLAHAVYTQGNFALSDLMLLSATGPQDLIDRSSMLSMVSEAQFSKVKELQLAKVQQANADSAAKQAVLDMTAAEAAAKKSLDEMNAKVDAANAAMAQLQSQKAALDAQLAAAQDQLFQLEGQKQTYQQWLAQKQAEEAAAAKAAADAAAAQAAAAQAAASAQAAAQAASQPGPSSSGPSSSAASSSPSVNGAWAKPAGGRLTSCFCARWGTFHYGIDIANAMMTPIYAAGNGVVKRAGSANGFGQAIYIQHDDGWVTVYGHIEAIYVSVGQRVSAGQQIAGMGTRGQSTGVHLHFETTKGMYGTRVDPIGWLAARGIYL